MAQTEQCPTPRYELVSALLVVSVPPLAVCLSYFLWLGHRSDYLGHFAAGYGGTLSALACLVAVVAPRWQRLSSLAILIGTIACIGAGTIAEATVFCLAKFDGVDYCNQNLGAVLAGLAMSSIVHHAKPADAILGGAMAAALIYLVMGVYFATT